MSLWLFIVLKIPISVFILYYYYHFRKKNFAILGKSQHRYQNSSLLIQVYILSTMLICDFRSNITILKQFHSHSSCSLTLYRQPKHADRVYFSPKKTQLAIRYFRQGDKRKYAIPAQQRKLRFHFPR